jgi:hypothetical protein
MKRFAMIMLAAATLVGGIGIASAQMHGSHGGRGGAMSSGGWHGGGTWHGGGNWHGGNFHNGNFRSRVFIGVGFGAPFWGWGWWPGYYSPYYYPAYYPAYPYYDGDYYPYDSSTYIEQGTPTYSQSAPAYGQGTQYWYYCPDPAGYYPQVPTCAKGWLRVVPSGAPGPTSPAPQ